MSDNTGDILKTYNLIKTYPGVRALDSINFNLEYGEVRALVGQNGAGKSTFIEIIAGSLQPDSGRIIFDGEEYSSFNPWKSIELGIQTVHQENQLVDELSIAENIYLYDLPRTKLGFINYNTCFKAAEDLLHNLGIDLNPNRKISNLSFIERKLVSIAKAFSRKAKLLILDEPTASLDENGKNILFGIIKKYTNEGLSVIYISHNLGEIFDICDKVTVFKDGKNVATHIIKEINMNDIVREMIGSKKSALYVRSSKIEKEGAKEVLEVKDYSRDEIVKSVSFSVRKGEIFGIAGLVGSGRTELARMIFGLDPKDSGKLFYEGKEITPSSPYDAIKKGIGYLTENRKDDGLLLIRPILENISLAYFAKSDKSLLKIKQEYENTQDISKQLEIKTPSIQQLVINLSGGNQQKVVIAKWLYAGTEILIFDEPTVGVDVGAKVEIYKMMEDLVNEGKIIIMISSDNPELLTVCDRIAVMRKGKLVKILEGNEKTEENILSYSMGVHEEQGV